MTYDAYERSAEAGEPVELYRFVIGATTYRYTSSEGSYTFEAYAYLPRQIARTNPTQSTEDRQQQLEISLPTTDDIAARFIGVVPGELMTIEVVRVHREDPDQEGLIIWSGRVQGASYQENGAVCVLRCLTTEASFSRSVPRKKYQGLCNHVLYDTSCGIDKETFKHVGNVLAVAERLITVDGLEAAKGAGWAVGGYVEMGEDWRLVVAQSGDVLTLILNFSANALGQSVNVYGGCDHSIATCNTKFSNTVRFGGFPFVPDRNPFETGVD